MGGWIYFGYWKNDQTNGKGKINIYRRGPDGNRRVEKLKNKMGKSHTYHQIAQKMEERWKMVKSQRPYRITLYYSEFNQYNDYY